MKTIAVIEDDQHIGNIIENALKKRVMKFSELTLGQKPCIFYPIMLRI